jgi:hypothetical protein
MNSGIVLYLRWVCLFLACLTGNNAALAADWVEAGKHLYAQPGSYLEVQDEALGAQFMAWLSFESEQAKWYQALSGEEWSSGFAEEASEEKQWNPLLGWTFSLGVQACEELEQNFQAKIAKIAQISDLVSFMTVENVDEYQNTIAQLAQEIRGHWPDALNEPKERAIYVWKLDDWLGEKEPMFESESHFYEFGYWKMKPKWEDIVDLRIFQQDLSGFHLTGFIELYDLEPNFKLDQTEIELSLKLTPLQLCALKKTGFEVKAQFQVSRSVQSWANSELRDRQLATCIKERRHGTKARSWIAKGPGTPKIFEGDRPMTIPSLASDHFPLPRVPFFSRNVSSGRVHHQSQFDGSLQSQDLSQLGRIPTLSQNLEGKEQVRKQADFRAALDLNRVFCETQIPGSYFTTEYRQVQLQGRSTL